MVKTIIEQASDLLGKEGMKIGPSDWMDVSQKRIDTFADATGDHQWIHVDVDRAKKEMPGSKTIAHGYLTLSMVPAMSSTFIKFKNLRVPSFKKMKP